MTSSLSLKKSTAEKKPTRAMLFAIIGGLTLTLLFLLGYMYFVIGPQLNAAEELKTLEVPQPQRLSDPVVFVNNETGRVTRVISSYQGVEFESEEFTPNDTRLEMHGASAGPERQILSTSTVEADGIVYPRNDTLSLQSFAPSTDDVVAIFNERIAGTRSVAETIALLAEASSITDATFSFFQNEIQRAADAGELPRVQYAITTKTLVEGDPKVVNGWLSNTPAWQISEEINRQPASDLSFYSHACLTYGVRADTSALVAAVAAIVPANLASIYMIPDTSEVHGDTEKPCEIKVDQDAVPPNESGTNGYNG